MSKQRPDPRAIANELAGASAFFRAPTARAAAPAPGTPAPVAPTGELASRPLARPGRREMIRHGFEIYRDQLEGLRALAAAERRRGGPGSMSKLVRDALDRLLAARGQAGG